MPVQKNVILYIDLTPVILLNPLLGLVGVYVDSLGSSMYIIYVYN